MATVSYQISRELPVRHTAEVVVVGGGPGGLGAAVMAARAGADVLLVERYGFLGGMASAGEVQPFMQNHAFETSLDKPVYIEWAERMVSYLPPAVRARIPLTHEVRGEERLIAKDAAMLAMEDLCLEAGVRLLYHHTLADVLMDGRRLDALVLLSKTGFTAVRGTQYVDCTGDADLAARAGCACEFGGPEGFCQPMTLCFKLSHIDKTRALPWGEMQERYYAAKARGEITCPRENLLQFSFFDDDVIHFNTTRVVQKSAIDGDELSEAEIEARRQVREYLVWMRRDLPGYEEAQIHSIAHHIGVRESRRVVGRAYLTRDSFLKAEKFPDGIARVRYSIDIHSPTGAGTEIVRLPEGEYYEIPYGCIVARDADNLTIGGRPISVDHAIHSSMRVMPPACSVGQAAGYAAALAAQRGVTPAELDGVEIRNGLRALGANL